MTAAPRLMQKTTTGGRDVARWAYGLAFLAAMGGGLLYMLEAGGHVALLEPLFGVSHKYEKLLIICVGVLVTGFSAFAAALSRVPQSEAA